jgi:hypothetical protein
MVGLGVASTLYLTKTLHRAPFHDIYVFEGRDGSIGARSSERGYSPACGDETVKRYWEPFPPLGPRILCVHNLVDDEEFASKSARLNWLVLVDVIRTNLQLAFPAFLGAVAGLLAALSAPSVRGLMTWILSAPGRD